MAREHRTDISNERAIESAGVGNLIDRLRDEGITEGRNQAEALVAAAKQQAADILASAKRDADTILIEAGREAGKLKAAGEDAVRLAMRDTVLSLESGLVDVFQNMVRHLIRATLSDPAFLERLILEVAGKAATVSAGQSMQLLLPAQFVSLEDLRRKPEAAEPGTLTYFVLSLGGGMLRDGVSFGATDDVEAGIRVKLVDSDMQVDLTNSSISDLMLRHMVPRFRALLRGAVAPDTKPALEAERHEAAA